MPDTPVGGPTDAASNAEDAPQPPSRRIDMSRPSVARVYDCFLGGKDNYAVDRAVFDQVNAVAPDIARLMREERAWLGRVTRFLVASARVEQFLDVGAGLPRMENTHEAAQRANSDVRVIYVDSDPVVLAHGRAILEENGLTHLVDADLTRPDDVLGHEKVRKYLEPDEPVGLILLGALNHVPDALRPRDIVRRYVELIPSGSYLVLTHFVNPQDGGPAERLARFVENVLAHGELGSGFFRPRAEVESYFEGLELVTPGIGRLRDWWPDGPLLHPVTPADDVLLGAVARKP